MSAPQAADPGNVPANSTQFHQASNHASAHRKISVRYLEPKWLLAFQKGNERQNGVMSPEMRFFFSFFERDVQIRKEGQSDVFSSQILGLQIGLGFQLGNEQRAQETGIEIAHRN